MVCKIITEESWHAKDSMYISVDNIPAEAQVT